MYSGKQARTQSGVRPALPTTGSGVREVKQEVGLERKVARVKVRLKKFKNAQSTLWKAVVQSSDKELCIRRTEIVGAKGFTLHTLSYCGNIIAQIILGPRVLSFEKIVEDFCKQIRFVRPELKQWPYHEAYYG